MASNPQFESYLLNNPSSSLNVFRDLYVSNLERSISLELQKLSVDFNTLTDDQRHSFFQEVDKALSTINALRDMIVDAKKQEQEELSDKQNFSKELEEKLKKEQEEQEQKKTMESLSVAIQRAALKTAADVNEYNSPSINALEALNALTARYKETNAKLVTELKELQKELTSKARIVPDKDSSVQNSLAFNPIDNTISQTGVLIAVLNDKNNKQAICEALGVPTKSVIELSADGKEIYVQGDESKRLPFSIVEEKFRTVEATPQVFRDVSLIRKNQELYENKSEYSVESGKQLNVAKNESRKWLTKVLAERGIVFDENKIDSQMAQIISTNPGKSFVERLEHERGVLASINRQIEEHKNVVKEINAAPGMQHHNLLVEIRQGVKLRKVEVDKINDRSAPNVKGSFTEKEVAKNKSSIDSPSI
ncbi:MAG: hypothetical protein K0R73_1336 [Candidatus Midichloriaceae bacterium]|jgi:hypothetical protein|nr:hypothetical protein [Candidatus Midichloriaceae bacterium]